MIVVTITYACDQCHKSIIETEDGCAFTDYMVGFPKGWRYARHKADHTLEIEVCPECQKDLHHAYELYGEAR